MKNVTDFSRIFASAPASKQAAVVTSTGTHWEAQRKANTRDSDNPPKTVPWKGPPEHLLTGTRAGRFTVVGYCGKSMSRGTAMWSLRCACGRYQRRSTAAVKKIGPDSGCDDCDYLSGLKNKDDWAFERAARAGVKL